MNNLDQFITVLFIIFVVVYSILLLKTYRRTIVLEKTIKAIMMKSTSKITKLRKRYVVFVINSDKRFSKKDVEESIRNTMSKLFGSEVLVKADPQLIYFDPTLQRGVVRTTHVYKEYVIATLGLLREINGEKCLVIPMKTTGTIKKARKTLYALRRELHG